jgi:hypothetical protein
MPPLVPSIEPLLLSVAVSVWLPVVLNVTKTVALPLLNEVGLGRLAALSLLLKSTVPL